MASLESVSTPDNGGQHMLSEQSPFVYKPKLEKTGSNDSSIRRIVKVTHEDVDKKLSTFVP